MTSVIPPGGGEVIGDAPDRRVEILCERDGVHATWSRFAPGRDGADPHIHRRHTDIFYVLAGELTVKLSDEEIQVPAGSFARVPPLVVHGFANRGEAELRYLNFHAPGVGFADYMRGLRDGVTVVYDQEPPPATGTRPKTEARIEDRVDIDGIRIEVLESDELHTGYVLDGALAGTWVDGGLALPAPARCVSVAVR
jgi:mannose-6-phosphate isomerase-like protein (cupin superfamily)